MDSVAGAALTSWNFDGLVIAALFLVCYFYVRGWLRVRTQWRRPEDGQRLGCFLGGIGLIFVATASPLDAFDSLYLAAHMTQHLLLMMFAPALILMGQPVVPILRGLPKAFVKEALGPFLTWVPLRKFFAGLTSPVAAWFVFVFSTILWHLPYFYELALGSPRWHAVQHASFFWTGILFWYPIIRPGPVRYRWPLWVGIPYLMGADLINTALSAFFIFSGKLLYPTYTAVKMGSITGQEDQTLAGAIMWVPGSVIYLIPVVAIVMRLLSPPRRGLQEPGVRKSRTTAPNRTRSVAPKVRRVAQYVMLGMAILVVWEGLFGSRLAALNLAATLPWIHWRALSILALLLVGNLFCLSCPFTLVRDWGRKFLPANRKWPRVLRNKWIPFVLIALYLWTYEAYGLWNSPWLTAWIIIGYFVAAFMIDGIYRGASFCKYVCPIGQYHFVSSLISPRQVAVRKIEICDKCKTYDCIRGNETSRGCELYLFQPKKSGNMDCTFCLDCVKACPHDNVSLIRITPAKTLVADPYRSGIGRFSRRVDVAALVLLVTFGAFVNAAGMITPVMMWEHHLHALLGPGAMPLIVAAFTIVGAIAIPLLVVALCTVQSRIPAASARRFIYALVPIGFAMWLAHLLYHLSTSWSAPLARFGIGATAYIPSWLMPVQILSLDAGLLLTLYVCWHIGRQVVPSGRSSIGLTIPWVILAGALYSTGIWIMFQPMQMRGMMMN